MPAASEQREATLERLLRGVPYFRELDRVSFARLIGALEEVHVPAGATIAEEGAEADSLYLLESGGIRLSVRGPDGEVEIADLIAPASFGELGMLLSRRTATARSGTDATLWRLPRARFEAVVRERPEIALAVATALADLLDRRQRGLIGAPLPDEEPLRSTALDAPSGRQPRRRRLIAGSITLAVPFILWWIAPPPGLDVAGWRVLAVLLGAAVGWLLDPVPDFVVAIAMAAVWGATGLAPLAAVFSGFTSSSWVLALGALALAAAMLRSGLLFRAALFALRSFPPTHRGQVLALVLGGALVTPLVPLSVARVSAIAPLTLELAQSLGYPPRSRGSAGLAFAGLTGYWYFSSIFLTGLATNFFILELLPAGDRARFGWLGWLAAAAPTGAFCLIGALVALFVLFPPERTTSVSTDALRRQRRVLGPLSTNERVTLAALAVLVAGLAAQPLLGVEPAWLAAIVIVIVTAGVLGREGFRTALDWPFLVFFGVLLGSGTVLQRAGIDRWLSSELLSLTGAIGSSAILVVLIAVFTMAVRIVLPSRPTMVLLGLALVPAAPALGIAPWIAGFVVLVAANVWVLPYQGIEYVLTRDAVRGEAFDDAQGTRFGAGLAIVRLAAIAASIPFWSAAGLIGR